MHTSIPKPGFALFCQFGLEGFDIIANGVIFVFIIGEAVAPEGVVIHELFVLLFEGEDIFVDFFDFFFEVVDFAPDHGQFLLQGRLVVGRE